MYINSIGEYKKRRGFFVAIDVFDDGRNKCVFKSQLIVILFLNPRKTVSGS